MQPASCASSLPSPSLPSPRRVMVVADASRESSTALQWALSHALLHKDDLILLHVHPTSSWRHQFSTFLKRHPHGGMGGSGATTTSGGDAAASSSVEGTSTTGERDFLEEMRGMCRASQPEVRVQVQKAEMEGKDKASVILTHAKLFAVDLLVVGQRRHLSRFIGMQE